MFSGTSPDERLVEVIELPRDVHPFYVASQYHPEFKSRPERPAPLFREFVGAALAPPARGRRELRERRRRLAVDACRPADGRTREAREPRRERARLHETFAALCRIESPTGRRARRAPTGSRSELAAIGLTVEEDDAGADGRVRRRQPARADPRARRRRSAAAVRPPGHGAADRAGRAGAARRRLGERQRRDPRRRQQGGGRRAARARAPCSAAPGPTRRSGSSCCSPSARRPGCTAPRRSTSARCAATFGYVFDHASPIGEIVVASPTHMRITARDPRPRRPRRASSPEDGRSAIVAAARAIAAMRLGPPRRGDDRQRRHDRRRHRDERRRRALPARGRGAQRRPGAAPTRSRPRSIDAFRTRPTRRRATST